MTPTEFATEVVIPAVSEFAENRLSRRHSYVACLVVYHLHDHIAWASHNGEVKVVRAALEKSAGEYWRIIEGVATGVKHAVVTSNKVKHVPGTETTRPPALWGIAVWDHSKWDDESGGLEKDHQGIRYDLYNCIVEVLRAYAASFPSQFAAVDSEYFSASEWAVGHP